MLTSNYSTNNIELRVDSFTSSVEFRDNLNQNVQVIVSLKSVLAQSHLHLHTPRSLGGYLDFIVLELN